MSELLALLSLMPELVALAREIMALINKLGGNDPKAFLIQCTQTFQDLKKAQTPEDFDAAARKISDLISHLP